MVNILGFVWFAEKQLTKELTVFQQPFSYKSRKQADFGPWASVCRPVGWSGRPVPASHVA